MVRGLFTVKRQTQRMQLKSGILVINSSKVRMCDKVFFQSSQNIVNAPDEVK